MTLENTEKKLERIINNKLPAGWRWVKLGEVCKLKNGFAFKSTKYKIDGIPVIRISDIKDGIVSANNAVKVKPDQEYENYLVENDDILVAMSGATTGKFGIFKSKEKAYQNQRVGKFKILDENILNSHFLYHQIHALKRQIEKDAYGGAQPNISSTKIEQMEVALPPLSEQHAIVSKIEELFSELDKGKQQLETTQQKLKVYRQAVLKWAFEGRLTNRSVKEDELPKGWKLSDLKAITSVLGDGLHGTPKYSESGEYYFINGNNLNNGKIEIKENTKQVTLEEYEKYKKPLNERTILVSINGSLGYTAFYNGEKVVLGKSACYFNVLDNVDKYYVRYYLTSSSFTRYAEDRATGSTIKNVGLKAMREFRIPMPPTVEEQQIIVQEIESRLSVCDKVEETIATSLQQAETLRQSILKRAFEGKLITVSKISNVRSLGSGKDVVK